MTLDPDLCHAALAARDRRFDGVFFVGVTTTGVYCRPVCPARTPGPDRCRYFADAGAAEGAGFRACLRCRPERAPGHAPVDASARLVRRAVARLEGGAGSGGLEALAGALGVTARHLRRAFEAELGVSPRAVVASRRLAVARQLLRDTGWAMPEIARAAGFGSERALRDALRVHGGAAALRRGAPAADAVALRLDARPPFDGAGVLAFLRARALPGVERVEGDRWERALRFGGRAGVVRVSVDARGVALAVPPDLRPALVQVAARVRRVFDLDARPDVIAARLGADPLLAEAVAASPGRRVPGAAEPFEAAVRAVLGQQISVRGATTLAARLVARFGDPLPVPADGLGSTFPEPAALAAAGVDEVRALGMPAARARTVIGLAAAVAAGEVDLEPGADPEGTCAALRRIPGVGPWTAAVVALRALGWPDAFPAGDLGVRRALGVDGDAAAVARAAAWRPWRSYAVAHLWAIHAGG